MSSSGSSPRIGVPPNCPLMKTSLARGAHARNVAPSGSKVAPIGVSELMCSCDIIEVSSEGFLSPKRPIRDFVSHWGLYSPDRGLFEGFGRLEFGKIL